MNTFTVFQAMQDFLLARRVERCTLGTLKWYEWHLKGLAAELETIPVSEVTAMQVRAYLVSNDRLSPESLKARHRALRAFFNWCKLEYHLTYSPMENIKSPRVPKPLPKAISKEDILKLLSVCGDTIDGRRDKAIVATLADTGIRAGGLLRLRPSDLNLARRYLTTTEKGEVTRRVPISEHAKTILESWLEVRPVWSLTLFCALSWGYTGQPLTNSGLNQLLRRLAGKAEITGRFNPHSFRHAFGIEMILAGADSAIVSKIMGHSSIKVTVDTYGNFGDDRRLSDHHDKFTLLREVDL